MVSKAKINRVKELYLGLPESWRTQIASAWHTFIPAFLGTFTAFLAASDTSLLEIGSISAAATMAYRAGFKALSVSLLSRALPDPKE